MRNKERCVVVAFDTTSDALAFERASRESLLSGRLVPIPRQLSAGCGLAWREPASANTEEDIRRFVAHFRLTHGGIHLLEL